MANIRVNAPRGKAAPHGEGTDQAASKDPRAAAAAPAPRSGALGRHHELVEGAHKHLQANLKDPHKQALIKRHEKSQHPDYFVLCCADSRYEPKDVFHMDSGRLFTFRNAGNMVTGELNSARFDPGMAGTLAYALQVLKVKHIIVLGHTGCGLVKAVMDGARAGSQAALGLHDWTTKWMSHAGHLKQQVDEHYDFSSANEQDLAAVGEHVLRQVERLRSLDIVREAFEANVLHDVIGAVYEIHNSGNVSVWDDDQEKFVSMSPKLPSSLPERHSKRDD